MNVFVKKKTTTVFVCRIKNCVKSLIYMYRYVGTTDL